MRVAILSSHGGWHTDELCHALAERGSVGVVLPYEDVVARIACDSVGDSARSLSCALTSRGTTLIGERDLDEVDAVVTRIIPAGSLEQIIYRVDALHWLEARGVTVMNGARAIERTVDKFLTSALLADAGLPTPGTVVCEQSDQAMDAFRAMGDVIVKPLFGSMGLGMVRVSDEDTAWRVFRAVEAIRGVFYLQRAIPHAGADYRAFVVDGRVVGAIQRRAAGWRTNVSRGAKASAVELSESLSALAVRAAQVVGADYAGVDLLPGLDGTVYVLEVNSIPGWRGLYGATGIDVAGAIVDTLFARHASARTRA